MADTVRSLAALQAVLADNTAGDISAQDVRDFLVSAYRPEAMLPGGRLTTESGVGVSTSDRTAQSTLYYTPFAHACLPIFDGTSWTLRAFSELSLALSGLTSGLPYDVFVYDSSGTLTLELTAWTNGTTRATALVRQDGLWVKTGATTRLYLGTIYTTGTTTTEDSATKRFVWNAYNPAPRRLFRGLGTAQHSYSTDTLRAFNNDTALTVEVVVGLAGAAVIDLSYNGGVYGQAGSEDTVRFPVGEDSSTAAASGHVVAYEGNAPLSNYGHFMTRLVKPVPLGYHYYLPLQAADKTTTYWNNCAGVVAEAGLGGSVLA